MEVNHKRTTEDKLKLVQTIHGALCEYFEEDPEKDIIFGDPMLINEGDGWQTFSISFKSNRVNFL